MGKGRNGIIPEYRRKRESIAHHKENAERYRNLVAGIVGIRADMDRVAHTQQARQKQTDTHERAKARREYGTVGALVAAAGVAAWGIIQAHGDTNRALRDAQTVAERQHEDTLTVLGKTDSQIAALQTQAEIMRGQLNIMVDQKRPWVGTHISLLDPVIFTDWNNNKGVNIRLKFVLKNYGDSPAINVRLSSNCGTPR
jgi:hypothetical protein